MTCQLIIKKFFGLLLLYCCIILGIFALQFRNELLYTKNFGQLKVTLRKTNVRGQSPILKNNFQIVYKGLLIFSDESHPVLLSSRGGASNRLQLAEYTENQTGFSLTFTSNVTLVFSVSASSFAVKAELPPGTARLSVPYRATGGFIVTDGNSEPVVFASKNENYALAASAVTAAEIVFTPGENLALFNPHTPSVRVQYASLGGYPLAQAAAYAEAVKQFRAAFLAELSPLIPSSMVERDIVAYVAEMASLNSYPQALAAVSAAFKTDNRRSYLSAPYFGSLASLSGSLSMYFTNQMNKLQQAQTNRKLDIFESEKLVDFLVLRNNPDLLKSILAIPGEQAAFQPSVTQAAGILDVWASLKKRGLREAALLEPVLPQCLDRIADDFRLQNDRLELSENGSLSATAAITVKVSQALINYGQEAQRSDVTAAGYFLFTSLAADGKITGAQAYADLYPFVVANSWYPHVEILAVQNGVPPVWAWTSSPRVTYSTNAEKTVTITVQFSTGNAHYLIINGIQPFVSIEMYGLNYRSDRQFETYNSSGYVYDADTKTLLLKVRNKAEEEVIRLFYAPPEPAATAG